MIEGAIAWVGARSGKFGTTCEGCPESERSRLARHNTRRLIMRCAWRIQDRWLNGFYLACGASRMNEVPNETCVIRPACRGAGLECLPGTDF
jgi:hypothetical protein